MKQVDSELSFTTPPIEMVAVQQLNPAAYNPRRISPLKFDGLKQGIRRNGFVENLVVQRQSKKYGPMVIVGGHQRLKAVREICIEDNAPVPKLPCVVLDLDDREAKLLNVALNNVVGDFDAKLLGELLEDVHHAAPVIPEEKVLMGFEEEDYSKYLKFSEPPRVDPDPEPIVGSATLLLKFRSKKARDAVRDKLEQRGKVSRKESGDVVLELLEGAKRKR